MSGKKRILIVDDEREISLVLSEFLVDEGYQVEVASSAWAALERLSEFNPDLVLSDNMMPVISGLELLKKFRELPEFRLTPFVLMSAAALRARQEDHLWTRFVRKPFDLDTILDVIRESLA